MYYKTKKVSIITVVCNGELLIEDTMKSLVNHPYDDIEYIDIEGVSGDGTVQRAKRDKSQSQIDKFVSEPDNGRSAAMNKGLRLAIGDCEWFANSGDHVHVPISSSKSI